MLFVFNSYILLHGRFYPTVFNVIYLLFLFLFIYIFSTFVIRSVPSWKPAVLNWLPCMNKSYLIWFDLNYDQISYWVLTSGAYCTSGTNTRYLRNVPVCPGSPYLCLLIEGLLDILVTIFLNKPGLCYIK